MDVVAAPDEAPSRARSLAALLCAAIGHRPDAPPVWNHGHGFAVCLRCERTIVRTIVHGWRLPPRGYRIRWPERDRRPASQPQPQPPAPSRPEPARPRLAVRDGGGDFMQDSAGGGASRGLEFDDFFTPPPDSATPKRRIPR